MVLVSLVKRFLDENGKLNLKEKNAPGKQDDSLTPWYAIANRKTRENRILFGHWSTVTLDKANHYKKYNYRC